MRNPYVEHRLTAEEMVAAHAYARGRIRTKTTRQSDRARVSSDTQWAIDYASARGIHAWASYLYLRVPNIFSVNGDGGFHLMLPSRATLDIKTVRRRGGPLMLGGEKRGMQLRTHYVAWAEVVDETQAVRLVGWVSAPEFRERAKPVMTPHGMRDVIARTALDRDPSALASLTGCRIRGMQQDFGL